MSQYPLPEIENIHSLSGASKTQIGPRIPEPLHGVFQRHVDRVHGSYQGYLGNEVTKALKMLLATYYMAHQREFETLSEQEQKFIQNVCVNSCELEIREAARNIEENQAKVTNDTSADTSPAASSSVDVSDDSVDFETHLIERQLKQSEGSDNQLRERLLTTLAMQALDQDGVDLTDERIQSALEGEDPSESTE